MKEFLQVRGSPVEETHQDQIRDGVLGLVEVIGSGKGGVARTFKRSNQDCIVLRCGLGRHGCCRYSLDGKNLRLRRTSKDLHRRGWEKSPQQVPNHVRFVLTRGSG